MAVFGFIVMRPGSTVVRAAIFHNQPSSTRMPSSADSTPQQRAIVRYTLYGSWLIASVAISYWQFPPAWVNTPPVHSVPFLNDSPKEYKSNDD